MLQLGVGPRLCTMYLDTHSNAERIGEAKEIKNKERSTTLLSVYLLKSTNKLQKLFVGGAHRHSYSSGNIITNLTGFQKN